MRLKWAVDNAAGSWGRSEYAGVVELFITFCWAIYSNYFIFSLYYVVGIIFVFGLTP